MKSEFCQMVCDQIYLIPVGKYSTYGDIAKSLGYPGYARQVGKCLHHTDEATRKKYHDLPWHRVVLSSRRSAFPEGSRAYKMQVQRLAKEGVMLDKKTKRFPVKCRLDVGMG